MSKTSDAKQAQGYIDKAVPTNCMNCRSYRSDEVRQKGAFGEWTREVNIRCAIGGFAVKKMATCRLFQAWEQP